jgi:uncharacterized membrane protein YgcG
MARDSLRHKRHKSKAITFSSLKWSEKMEFYNWWHVSTLVAALLSVVHAILVLWNVGMDKRTGSRDDVREKLVVSCAIFLCWCCSAQWIMHRFEYARLMKTMSIGVPRVAQFMVGVTPVLIAYAIFGFCFFANHSDWFGNFSSSMVALFAVMNGDQMADTFKQVGRYPAVSQIYLYSFIMLFIYVVLNIFIAIMETSHDESNARNEEEAADNAQSNASLAHELHNDHVHMHDHLEGFEAQLAEQRTSMAAMQRTFLETLAAQQLAAQQLRSISPESNGQRDSLLSVDTDQAQHGTDQAQHQELLEKLQALQMEQLRLAEYMAAATSPRVRPQSRGSRVAGPGPSDADSDSPVNLSTAAGPPPPPPPPPPPSTPFSLQASSLSISTAGVAAAGGANAALRMSPTANDPVSPRQILSNHHARRKSGGCGGGGGSGGGGGGGGDGGIYQSGGAIDFARSADRKPLPAEFAAGLAADANRNINTNRTVLRAASTFKKLLVRERFGAESLANSGRAGGGGGGGGSFDGMM